MRTGSKHRSNVQGNEENSVNIATVKHLLLKSETNTETETNFRILQIYFFFGIKDVRVGRKHILLFFWPKCKLTQTRLYRITCSTISNIPYLFAVY